MYELNQLCNVRLENAKAPSSHRSPNALHQGDFGFGLLGLASRRLIET